MLCDSTKTQRKLYGDCAETSLRIIRSEVAVKAAIVREGHTVSHYLSALIALFSVF